VNIRKLNESGRPAKNEAQTWGVRLLYAAMFLPFFVWGIFALWWGSWPHRVCVAIMVLYVIAHVAVIILAPKRRVIVLGFLVFLIPLASFFFMQPSNDRNWQPDVALTPYAEINGNKIAVHNVRNCEYITETDYVTKYETRTYDLSKLRSVDVMLTDWGLKYIAHTMVSFGFEGDQYLCFSIETRKETGEDYSALKGFFRQYELIYIAADERDLVGLRTKFRKGEDVYLYRLRSASIDKIQAFFMDYLNRMNQLHAHPEWYNALTQNCMTSAFRLARKHAAPGRGKWHWSIILNGFADRHAYENKTIDTSLPFDELKRLSRINDRAVSAEEQLNFSAVIRHGMPGMNWMPEKGGVNDN
jgi:hypothetical protein